MLPDGSGLDLLERLKALHKRENVIIISAKDSLEDKVLGLELGADDYLPKPFHLVELNARIKSVIRRHQHDGEIDIRQGNVRIEPDKYRVFVNEQEVEPVSYTHLDVYKRQVPARPAAVYALI